MKAIRAREVADAYRSPQQFGGVDQLGREHDQVGLARLLGEFEDVDGLADEVGQQFGFLGERHGGQVAASGDTIT